MWLTKAQHVGRHPQYDERVIGRLARIDETLSPKATADQVRPFWRGLVPTWTLVSTALGNNRGDRQVAEQVWQTDWQEFVNLMAQLYASGSLESEISERLRGQRVSWRGTVTKVRMGAKYYAPGIVMNMPAPPVHISGRRSFVGNHLFLPLKNSQVTVREGDIVSFEAQITRDPILDPIEFVEDHETHKVHLQTSVDEVTLRPD